jgi:ribosomal protein L11 methyltransferase
MAEANSVKRNFKGRSYGRIAFDIAASRADEAGAIIVALGALGCEVANLPRPTAKPARRPKMVRLIAYFEHQSSAQLRRMAARIRAAIALDDHPQLIINTIQDPGWATMWMARFEPFTIGERFLIVPPWSNEHRMDRLRIVIQPGQGFGTGHHGSTYGVLRMLEEVYADNTYRRVLDVGTGSGILAIAMKLMGAGEVTAIDVDPAALENAHENAALNHVERDLRISAIPLRSIRRHFDLITANILASTVIELAPRLKRNLAPSGRLILAGILAREAAKVIEAYQPELRCIRRRTNCGWTSLLMTR